MKCLGALIKFRSPLINVNTNMIIKNLSVFSIARLDTCFLRGSNFQEIKFTKKNYLSLLKYKIIIIIFRKI